MDTHVQVKRSDLAQLRSAGLQALHKVLGVPWRREAGLTNAQRREELWARLAGEGEESVPVDAASWAAARALGGKAPVGRFEELVKEERLKLARRSTYGRLGEASGNTPERPRAARAAGHDGEEAGEASAARALPQGRSRFSMDGDAMSAPRTRGVGAADALNLEELAQGWQVAGLRQRQAKKAKRGAEASPLVEQTPPRRDQRGEREGAGGGAAGTGDAQASSDQARGGSEEALRRAASVLEEAQWVLESFMELTGVVDPALRARAAASNDAMKSLCAGMALQRVRSAAAEHRRTAQELARATKDLEKAKRGPAAPRFGPQGRSWAQVAVAPDLQARPALEWDAARTFFLHPAESAWLTKNIELAAFEDALHSVVAGVPGAQEGDLRPIRTTVRTGRGAVRVEVAPAVAALFAGQADRAAGVAVPGFGEWRIERQRPGASASLVAMGISPALGDGEVAQRLLTGSRGLVPERLRGEFGALCAARLHSKRRVAARGGGAQSGEAGAAGAAGAAGEAGGSQEGAVDAVPTRSVRIFLPGAVLKGFLQLGYMKLGGVVVRVREYTPPLAYCGICKRHGSHPTEAHRPSRGAISSSRVSPQ